ncbi:MarR family transcriptional regulator [Streptomonospora sp. S1-112]|uniref:MarR family transcriptional regulator n=1 Tax=Streptomonospora mangrovi TaxID=2883123 RepID=A0A9X3NYM3_9ACTN|nr:MarR family transcriptional regulator [Streptomonospora mangrovi]MDA0566811.1 MarR family transcriptional regulator [Streptomonospora mangrovi]
MTRAAGTPAPRTPASTAATPQPAPAPPGSAGPTARDAGEALLRAAERLNGLLTDLAQEHGLSALQARALRALSGGPTQGGLSRQLGCTPSVVSALTRDLEARGLVVRRASRSDKRVRLTTPTPRGREVLAAIGAGLAERSPLSHLPPERVADLAAVLAELERLPPGGAHAPAPSPEPAAD